MKSMTRKQLWIAISVIVLVLALAVGFIMLQGKPRDRLSEQEIAALREQYPICGTKQPDMASLAMLSLEQSKTLSDSLVYAEVIGDVSTYTIPYTTGNDLFDEEYREAEKKGEIKPLPDIEFFEYTLRVIDDTEGEYAKEEIISIAANAIFRDYLPKLSNGMRVLVPVTRDKEVNSRSYYTIEGMFYVTEDEYVLAAYPQTRRISTDVFSGLTVRQAMKEWKRLKPYEPALYGSAKIYGITANYMES